MLTATNRSNIKISKEIELKRFSEKTSRFIKEFNTIFLYGELGVGKTTFAKYLINNLQKKKECLNIGLFEDDDVISIIEWPEKVHFKPKKRIEIYFKYFDNYNSRLLKIKFFG